MNGYYSIGGGSQKVPYSMGDMAYDPTASQQKIPYSLGLWGGGPNCPYETDIYAVRPAAKNYFFQDGENCTMLAAVANLLGDASQAVKRDDLAFARAKLSQARNMIGSNLTGEDAAKANAFALAVQGEISRLEDIKRIADEDQRKKLLAAEQKAADTIAKQAVKQHERLQSELPQWSAEQEAANRCLTQCYVENTGYWGKKFCDSLYASGAIVGDGLACEIKKGGDFLARYRYAIYAAGGLAALTAVAFVFRPALSLAATAASRGSDR